MSKHEYIPVTTDRLPELFEIDLGSDSYFIGINYNQFGAFFTIDLFDNQNQPIVLGEPLIYGRRLFSMMTDTRLPAVDIVPFDESGRDRVITLANFGITVFLYFMSEPEELEDIQNGKY